MRLALRPSSPIEAGEYALDLRVLQPFRFVSMFEGTALWHFGERQVRPC
jgi:hypothetical protein